jgi:hypothetical protein
MEKKLVCQGFETARNLMGEVIEYNVGNKDKITLLHY